MNKSELIDAIAKDAGITKVAAKAALESFISNVTSTLKKKDGKVSLVGFGTFSVAERAARQGINPATKKPIKIAAKKVAKFKAGADLSNAVSGAKKNNHSDYKNSGPLHGSGLFMSYDCRYWMGNKKISIKINKAD